MYFLTAAAGIVTLSDDGAPAWWVHSMQGRPVLTANVVSHGQGRPVGSFSESGSRVLRRSHWRSQILTEWSRLAERTLLLSKGWKSCGDKANVNDLQVVAAGTHFRVCLEPVRVCSQRSALL